MIGKDFPLGAPLWRRIAAICLAAFVVLLSLWTFTDLLHTPDWMLPASWTPPSSPSSSHDGTANPSRPSSSAIAGDSTQHKSDGSGNNNNHPTTAHTVPPLNSSHPALGNIEVTVPSGVKVIGLVFFGRKEFVEILDCYLRRNLKSNGGLLDEVIFAASTNNEADLAYLEELLASEPGYRRHHESGNYDKWLADWESVTGPDNIYIKIDDDVIYIEDHTIAAMVKRLLEEPHLFAVSANVVNNPALSWVHYSMSVYEPYWPETMPPKTKSKATWRASELPAWEGENRNLGPPANFSIDGSTAAPFKGHRWLPVRPADGIDIATTPASTLTFDAEGPGHKNWAAAAQTHSSFLHHMEQGDTWRYYFDKWDYAYSRLSINFFGIRGRDIMDAFPFPIRDDERYLTMERPKAIGRHVIVDGAGIAVHFAFNVQRDTHDGHGLMWTDLLARYRLYADEFVCPHPKRDALR